MLSMLTCIPIWLLPLTVLRRCLLPDPFCNHNSTLKRRRVGGYSKDFRQAPNTRCGGPEDPRPEDEEFGDSDDPDFRLGSRLFKGFG